MERGIPSEEVLAAMRDPQGAGSYLLGTSRNTRLKWSVSPPTHVHLDRKGLLYTTNRQGSDSR